MHRRDFLRTTATLAAGAVLPGLCSAEQNVEACQPGGLFRVDTDRALFHIGRNIAGFEHINTSVIGTWISYRQPIQKLRDALGVASYRVGKPHGTLLMASAVLSKGQYTHLVDPTKYSEVELVDHPDKDDVFAWRLTGLTLLSFDEVEKWPNEADFYCFYKLHNLCFKFDKLYYRGEATDIFGDRREGTEITIPNRSARESIRDSRESIFR